MMDERDELISELLFRRITGTITEQEQEFLDDWRHESTKHEELYTRMLDTELLKQGYRQRKVINVERPMHDMLKRIQSESKRTRSTYLQIWTIAASLALFIGIGATLLWHRSTRPPEGLLAETIVAVELPEIKPGETKAVFTAADGEEVMLGADEYTNLATMKAHHTLAAKQPISSPQLILNVPRGAEFKIILEDGSEIWLNSASELIYPESFSDTERRVTVSGEAYFKIAKEEGRPFFVETGKQLIQVYGTEFNIRSYNEDEDIYTTLVNGSIALSKADGMGGRLMLTPGHQALFNKEDEATLVRPVDTEVVTSWRHGRFVFEEQKLEQIMIELSRWYSFDFSFEDDSLRQIVFMGSIPRYSEFDTTLNILEKSGGIRFEVDGTTVTIVRK